jgi:hypothetical protein
MSIWSKYYWKEGAVKNLIFPLLLFKLNYFTK